MARNGIGIKLNGLDNVIKRYIASRCDKAISNVDKLSVINNRIICYIYENKEREIFARDIEREFKVTRSTVSKVIDIMENKGLIKRVSIIRDARLKKLILTDSAKEMARKISEELDAFESKMLEGFSPEEQRQLFSYIERMTNNILKII